MKRIWEKIKAFVTATDKQLHSLAAFSIAALIYILIVASQKWYWAMTIGAVISAIVCIIKEVYDKQNPDKHSFEWGDVIADALGLLVFILATFINIGQ